MRALTPLPQRGLKNVTIRLCRLLVVSLMIGLGGCAAFKGYPERVTDPEADLKGLESQLNASAIAKCLASPSVTCRDEIVSARMYATDVRFSQFEESLFKGTREAGFSATLGTLGLTTAAAASTGRLAQTLSGLSAFIIGGREAFQKEILSERTVIAIHTAMRSRRAQVALRLRSGMTQSLANYPLPSALSDLNEYYHAGTVLGALVGITESVGADAKEAEAELSVRFSFKPDDAAQKLKLAICGDTKQCSSLNDEAVKRMKKDCWPKSGVPADTLTLDFMLQAKFARERIAVGACMAQ